MNDGSTDGTNIKGKEIDIIVFKRDIFERILKFL